MSGIKCRACGEICSGCEREDVPDEEHLCSPCWDMERNSEKAQWERYIERQKASTDLIADLLGRHVKLKARVVVLEKLVVRGGLAKPGEADQWVQEIMNGYRDELASMAKGMAGHLGAEEATAFAAKMMGLEEV